MAQLVSRVNNHDGRKSPRPRVVGPLPNGPKMAGKTAVVTNHLLYLLVLR